MHMYIVVYYTCLLHMLLTAGVTLLFVLTNLVLHFCTSLLQSLWPSYTLKVKHGVCKVFFIKIGYTKIKPRKHKTQLASPYSNQKPSETTDAVFPISHRFQNIHLQYSSG